MTDILIDNKSLKTVYGIDCLDYSGALSFAAERENEMQWADKSGVDKNLVNIRYEAKEFVLQCVVKDTNEVTAFNKVKTLVDYMFSKGCFVLSIRDTTRSIRECFICERSSTIVGDIHIRPQNGLYYFKLGLKDINPNAVKYKTIIEDGEASINYLKGQTATLYWGNGEREDVTNSGTYTKTDYVTDGVVDIIVDIDSNTVDIIPLVAEFSADVLSGYKSLTVQFTDESTGDIIIWSWDFGDTGTSDQQHPSHTYDQAGVHTVTLQVFNVTQGYAVETKTNYITVINSILMSNDTDHLLINSIDKMIIN